MLQCWRRQCVTHPVQLVACQRSRRADALVYADQLLQRHVGVNVHTLKEVQGSPREPARHQVDDTSLRWLCPVL